MKTKKSCSIRVGIAILLALFALPLMPGHSDTVTLKDGKKIEGLITFEATDFIKIELKRSGSIKETKLIKRADISTISKTKPDVLALAKIKKSLPTPSLMTSSDYRILIQTGPEAFLKAYPESLLKENVKEILEKLNAEKAKVDRGAIKLEGEWISAEKRRDFKTLIKSQIYLYSMKQKAGQRNYTSALRDLQIIEDQYLGTPAYPEAVKVAISILPSYGQLLTRQLKDAEFLNKKREADIKLLPLESQARTQAAYQKEQDRFKALAEQEKKTGIKWRSVNRRNKESIGPMIDTIKKELDHLRKTDTAKLEEQAKILVQVDELINENKLKEAQELLVVAGGKVTSSKRKSSSRSKKKSSYSDNLSKKIAFKINAAEEAAKNATVSAKAKEVAAAITQAAAKLTEGDDQKEGAEMDGEKNAKKTPQDAQEAAMAARKKVAAANKKEADAKAAAQSSKKPKSTKKKRSTTKKRSSSTASSEEGGINFQFILIGFAAVMGIVIFVLKKKGVGGGTEGGE